MPSEVFSCFVDDNPLMRAQCFVWINCLVRLQRIAPAAIFVHVTATTGCSAFDDWLAGAGVQVIEAAPFDPRNRYCNKLQQLATFEGVGHDRIVLMDCDTAWIGTEPLPGGAQVAAGIVDFGNPPASTLAQIFAASGLGEPRWCPARLTRFAEPELTDINNCNGGVYVFAGDFLTAFSPLWRHWALWCLDNVSLFGRHHIHVDQVSFALAMRAAGSVVSPLPITWNYPAHVPVEQISDSAPQILHYHRQMGPDLRFRRIGSPQVDAALDRLETLVAGFPRPAFLTDAALSR